MAKVFDLLSLKCRANHFRVVIWNKDNKIVETKDKLSHCELEKYWDDELLSFDVAPELAELPTYFMGEEMRLIRPVITLNVMKK